MAKCPFCEGEIEETLAQYGGPCPKCFADIPGEEAPTDPGEEKKAIIRRKEKQRAVLSAVIPLMLAVPLVSVGLLLVIILTVRPFDPKVADALDFDDDEYYMPVFVGVVAEATPPVMVRPDPKDPDQKDPEPPLVAAVLPTPNPNNDGVADADVPPKDDNPKPAYVPSEAPDGADAADAARERMMNNPLFGGGAGDVGSDDPFANLTTDDRAYKEEGGLRSVSDYGAVDVDINMPALDKPRAVTPAPSSSTDLSDPISVTASRGKPTIERADEVKDHIWSVMKNSLPTLQYCY
ncbi:MAG: hypothetical protein HN348_10545, partial [Proteobacteria bacterium]|nr:hypothetical protein [Pseudomonadota bacterium]